MASNAEATRVFHPVWGDGHLVRVEGTDWLVHFTGVGRIVRLPAESRGVLVVRLPKAPPPEPSLPRPRYDQNVAKSSPLPEAKGVKAPLQLDPNGVARFVAAIKAPSDTQSTVRKPKRAEPTPSQKETKLGRSYEEFRSTDLTSLSPWEKRRAIESLANGLPPSNGFGRYLAVDFEQTTKLITHFLGDVSDDGGGALVIKGGYGQGKTFALRALEEIACEAGFLVARTEIDASENRLSKPHSIYRDLLRHLRVPGSQGRGASALAAAAARAIHEKYGHVDATSRFHSLSKEIGCQPLAWLLSDPQASANPEMIGLLAGDPQAPVIKVRLNHAVLGIARYWPSFNAGTQGDFACFLLSGIGRLARFMGLRGLVIIMDEMEKWQELNWQEQSRAGNLLGGLIWGSTESHNRRRRPVYPGGLAHSGRCGGYPFSTEDRSFVGLAIAMTPRSEEDDPERMWVNYGPLLDIDLPRLSVGDLKEYCHRAAPIFSDAYGTRVPSTGELETIIAEAVGMWKSHGEMTNRSAVQSAVAAFQNWRERVFYSTA